MRRFDFPLLEKTIYLDSGASMLKPLPVIEEMVSYYRDYPMNTHSMDSALGSKVYKLVNDARKEIAELVDATPDELIFTSGTTDGLNRLARMCEQFIKKGDKIVISKYNHASNVVPWIKLAERTGAITVLSDDLFKDIDKTTKVVAYSQVNNSIHDTIDPDELANKVESVGAVLVNDAAQAIVNEKVSLDNSDVIVFSATKIYGPTGIGALIIKKELLDMLQPVTFGGGAHANVISSTEVIDKDTIKKYEPGSPDGAGIIGFAAGVRYMKKYDDFERRKDLSEYAYNKLNQLGNIKFLSQPRDGNVLFQVEGIFSQDVVSYLGHRNIIVRGGRHCSHYLFNNINEAHSIRMSFGLYNNEEDIDKAVEAIKKGGNFVDI